LSKAFQQYAQYALNDSVGIWTDCVRILESLKVYYAYCCKSLDKYLSKMHGINSSGL